MSRVSYNYPHSWKYRVKIYLFIPGNVQGANISILGNVQCENIFIHPWICTLLQGANIFILGNVQGANIFILGNVQGAKIIILGNEQGSHTFILGNVHGANIHPWKYTWCNYIYPYLDVQGANIFMHP